MRTIPIELKGKTWQLRYNMNALYEIEQRLGALENLSESMQGVGALRTLLWAGLLHEDRSLTEWDVGSWVDSENMAEVTEAIATAIAEQYGTSDEGNQAAVQTVSTGAS